MPLSDIVSVSITRDSFAPTRVGFGRLLVLGATDRFANSDLIRVYTDLDGMLSDGFLTSDNEYKAAAKYFGQSNRPVDIAIGLRGTDIAQVQTVTIVTVTNNANYILSVNGESFDYLSDGSALNTEIRDGLIALINASAQPVTAASTGATTFTITADSAGQGFTFAESDAKLSSVATTANVGVQEHLAAIVNSAAIGNDWFGLMLTSHTEGDIDEAAAYVETRRKLFGYATADAGVLANTAGNLAADLLALGYAATFGMYSADAANYPEAAWFGAMLAYLPGEATWALKPLTGITADVLTSTQRTNLEALNITYYETVAGRGVTKGGKVAEGEWIDTIIIANWTAQRMQEDVFVLLAASPKVPFTDQGIAQVGAVVSGVLKEGEGNGAYAPRDLDGKAFVVTLPKASSFSSAERQTRNLTRCTFAGFLAGAVHTVAVTGDVSA